MSESIIGRRVYLRDNSHQITIGTNENPYLAGTVGPCVGLKEAPTIVTIVSESYKICMEIYKGGTKYETLEFIDVRTDDGRFHRAVNNFVDVMDEEPDNIPHPIASPNEMYQDIQAIQQEMVYGLREVKEILTIQQGFITNTINKIESQGKVIQVLNEELQRIDKEKSDLLEQRLADEYNHDSNANACIEDLYAKVKQISQESGEEKERNVQLSKDIHSKQQDMQSQINHLILELQSMPGYKRMEVPEYINEDIPEVEPNDLYPALWRVTRKYKDHIVTVGIYTNVTDAQDNAEPYADGISTKYIREDLTVKNEVMPADGFMYVYLVKRMADGIIVNVFDNKQAAINCCDKNNAHCKWSRQTMFLTKKPSTNTQPRYMRIWLSGSPLGQVQVHTTEESAMAKGLAWKSETVEIPNTASDDPNWV